MGIELRRTTANNLPYVLSAEGDDDSSRFIAVWPEEKHRAAVEGRILTVRFMYRRGIIRIFGAGHWRKGKHIYERENHLHQ